MLYENIINSKTFLEIVDGLSQYNFSEKNKS